MYLLTRVSLQNWYLFDAEDIPIQGMTGIVGATGSGKTSILDAIQTVMFGGNHNVVTLNPAAEIKSQRTILEYCLGYLTPKRDGGKPVRPSGETVLALTFTETQKNGQPHHVSVGLVMEAYEEDSRETLKTRFIAPGYAYSVQDWRGDDGYMLGWEEITKGIKARCSKMMEYRTAAEKFVGDVLATMRHRARPPVTRQFQHAFKTAVAFTPIKDPTSFIRSVILEEDNVDIDRVRERVTVWRALTETIKKLEEKIAALRRVRRAYDEWGTALLDHVESRWRRASASLERRLLTFMTARISLQEVEAERDRLVREVGQQARIVDECQKDLDLKRLALSKTGTAVKLANIEAQRQLLAVKKKEIEEAVERLKVVLRMASNLDSARQHLPKSTVPMIAAAKAALVIIDAEPGTGWLDRHASDVQAHVDKLKGLAAVPERLQEPRDAVDEDLATLKKRRTDIQDDLLRLGGGRSALSDPTKAFVRLLKADGIEATALCDVVEVKDASWQFAVEAVLGLGREAVIVDPSKVRRAHEILYQNRNREGLHNCRLVKTTRTHEVELRIRPDSLASTVSTDDQHAMAYLVTHLGGFKMVDTNEELEREKRAIMRNGKTTSGLDYRVHRDISLLFGHRAREASREAAVAAVAAVQAQIVEKERTKRLLEQAALNAAHIGTYSGRLEDLAFEHGETQRKNKSLDEEKRAAVSDDEKELVAAIEALEADIRERKEEIAELSGRLEPLRDKASDNKAAAKKAREDVRTAVRERTAARTLFQNEDVVRVGARFAQEQARPMMAPVAPFRSDRQKNKAEPDAAIARLRKTEKDESERLERNPDTRYVKLGGDAKRALDDYCRTYSIEQDWSPDRPWSQDLEWVTWKLIRLEQNELRDYKDRTETAAKEMILAIKGDLLTRLTDKFRKLDQQLDSLNRNLRNHRFTGQIYKFEKKANGALERIRRLALAVSDNPEAAQAIIEKRHEDPELRDAMTDLETYIEMSGSEGLEDLEDYRQYFTFDLSMTQPEAAGETADGSSNKTVGRMTLSARAAVSSGGEGQVPYYVAMGAAMAMAYFPDGQPTGEPTGMGLIMFDEAFSKIDIPNSQNVIKFFRSLNLQLVAAAPETARPTFTEVMDTIMVVSKSVATQSVYVASEYPKERARRELRAINPHHKGVEGYRADLERSGKRAAGD